MGELTPETMQLIMGVVIAACAGAIIYIVAYPYLSGELKAEKRIQGVSENKAARTARRAKDEEVNNRRRQVADTLGRRGVAVLRMDDRGINGSGGDLVKATSADFADDIRAGIAYLRTRPEIDGGRIGLIGHSEGGMIGPMVAASDPKVKAVVLMAGPAYTGQKIIDFQLRNLVENNTEIPADKKDSILAAAKVPFGKEANAWTKYFLTYDPIATLKKVKQPVLIMQGGTDQQITPEQAPIIERTLKGAGNNDVTLKLFPDRNHLFLKDPIGFPSDYVKLKNGKIDAEVMGTLAEWVVAKLAAK